MIIKSQKQVLTARIKNLNFYPFSKSFYALSISKRLQLNARSCSLNANFSAIYFTRKRISHGSAKHLVENKVDVKQSKKEQYDTAKKKKKIYIYIYIYKMKEI